MNNQPPWSRRKFSKSVLSLQMLASSGLLTALACDLTDESKHNGVLDPSLEKILIVTIDEIIPQSNEMPSASQVDVQQYILNILKENLDLVPAFEQVITQLNILSMNFAKNDFINLNSRNRVLVLKEYEKTQPEFFGSLVIFVYEGYYINEKVWKLIGYKPYPTLSPGPKMKPFDENLLNKMKKIEPFYTKI